MDPSAYLGQVLWWLLPMAPRIADRISPFDKRDFTTAATICRESK
jgi:hypothetical protein